MRRKLVKASAILFLAFLAVGYGMSTEQIGETVKASMQQKFDSDPQLNKWHLTVESVQVLKQGDNRYQGIAKVRHEGIFHDVPVEITADGSNVIWKTEPGAFMFVAQEEIENLQHQNEIRNEIENLQHLFQRRAP